jgi:hypothetical protein
MTRKVETIFKCTFILALALLLSSGRLCAQDNSKPTERSAGPTVTASAAGDRVRITAPASVVQMRLEIYAPTGLKVWDSEIHGNVFDWHLQDGQAQRASVGDYLCVVTVKNVAGRVTQKIGSISVSEKDARVGKVEAGQLSAPQSQAIGPVEEDASWTILTDEQNQTTTVIAHDGTDGQMIRSRGALSFRLGNFFSGNDQEQMRLTEEGNLGIGTAKPKFKLDVAGAIRAREGFVFNDGSTLKVNDKGELTRTAADGSVTPNIAGTGTQGRLAKWTDNSGTLGDSVVLDTGTGLQLTAAPSNQVETNLIYLNSPTGTMGVLASSVPSFGAINGPYFALRGNQFTTFPNQRGNFAISAGQVSNPAALEGGIKFLTGDDQLSMFINNAGNVGVGTASPAQLLHVNSAGGNAAALVQTPTGRFAQYQLLSGATNPWIVGTQNDFAGNALLFRNGGSDLMVVRPNGNVGIGTTNPALLTGVTGRMLEISNPFSPGLALTNSSTGGNQYFLYSAAFGSAGTGSFRLYDANNQANRLIIDNSGNAFFDGSVQAAQFIQTSDRNAKANFALVDPRSVLQRLAAIPIQTWNFKSQPESVRHIGPVAQDFRDAFRLGTDDKHIATVDADGVALAAIQGLYQIVQEKEKQIQQLHARVLRLERAANKRRARR